MNAALTVALITLAGTGLLAYRSSYRWRRYHPWELFGRGVLLVLMANLFVAYLDVAADGPGMLWRQWLVAAPLVAFSVSQAGSLWSDHQHKHRR